MVFLERFFNDSSFFIFFLYLFFNIITICTIYSCSFFLSFLSVPLYKINKINIICKHIKVARRKRQNKISLLGKKLDAKIFHGSKNKYFKSSSDNNLRLYEPIEIALSLIRVASCICELTKTLLFLL